MTTDTAEASAAADTAPNKASEASLPARREMSQHMAEVAPGFETAAGFELTIRMAKAFSQSTLVPEMYRDQKAIKNYGKVVGWEPNPSAISNCMIAINMAQRMRADPLLIMQNLYVIEGRPSWASQFIGAMIATSGRFSELEFDISEAGEPRTIEYEEVQWKNNEKMVVKKKLTIRDQTCVAYATSRKTGKVLKSPTISIDMAVAEGWMTKKGSKWQTIPELMLIYRAQSFFGKLYAPDLLMGMMDQHEAIDLSPEDWREVKPADVQKQLQARGNAGLTAALGSSAPPAAEAEDEDVGAPAKPTDAPKDDAPPADKAEPEAKPEVKEKPKAEPNQTADAKTPATTGRPKPPGGRFGTKE